MLPEAVLGHLSRLDQAAIAEVRQDAWPDVRDAAELHDALQTLIAFPVWQTKTKVAATGNENQPLDFTGPKDALAEILRKSEDSWQGWFAELLVQRRAGRASVGDRSYWVAAERMNSFLQLFPDAQFAGRWSTPLDRNSLPEYSCLGSS